MRDFLQTDGHWGDSVCECGHHSLDHTARSEQPGHASMCCKCKCDHFLSAWFECGRCGHETNEIHKDCVCCSNGCMRDRKITDGYSGLLVSEVRIYYEHILLLTDKTKVTTSDHKMLAAHDPDAENHEYESDNFKMEDNTFSKEKIKAEAIRDVLEWVLGFKGKTPPVI